MPFFPELNSFISFTSKGANIADTLHITIKIREAEDHNVLLLPSYGLPTISDLWKLEHNGLSDRTL